MPDEDDLALVSRDHMSAVRNRASSYLHHEERLVAHGKTWR